MNPKTLFLTPTLVIVTLVASTRMNFAQTEITFAQTEILTFDELPTPWNGSSYEGPIASGYGGLQWNNFYVLDAVDDSGSSGYPNALVSGKNVAFNWFGNPALISDGSFNLNSAFLTAAWNDGLNLEVQGFVGSTLTYDNTYILNTTGTTLIHFNYFGLDEVNFISSGGVPHAGYSGSGTQFAMDNLSITMIPEPSTFPLVELAVMLLILHRLRPRWHPTATALAVSRMR